jgi:hypothetical protein
MNFGSLLANCVSTPFHFGFQITSSGFSRDDHTRTKMIIKQFKKPMNYLGYQVSQTYYENKNTESKLKKFYIIQDNKKNTEK